MDLLRTLSTFPPGYINLIGLGTAVFNFLASYGLGHLAVRKILPVYVTRKILHILFYLSPFLVRVYVPHIYLFNFSITYSVAVFLHFVVYLEALRKKSQFVNVSFAAVDREQDRPYSGRLLLLQDIEKLLVVNAAQWFSSDFLEPHSFYLIAYFTVMLGDGLAEPIGNWIRSPKYKTFSVFATRGNFRTLAGSACVYLVPFLLVFWFLHNDANFWLYLLVVPLVAMVTEAISPRTMDNPIVFVGTLCALHLVQGSAL